MGGMEAFICLKDSTVCSTLGRNISEHGVVCTGASGNVEMEEVEALELPLLIINLI